MNTKNDPLPKEPHDPVLIEVKATLGRQVTAAWSTVEINGNQFDQQLIRSEYFMLVENNPRPKIFLRSEIFYAHSN
jgi:hypothetical protein